MNRRPSSTDDLLAEIARLGVSASVDGDRLVLRGPQGAVTPTLRAALARHKGELLERLAPAGAGTTAAIPRVPRDGPLPLSFAQQRLWFLDRLGAGVGYNVPGALRLSGRLDVGALGAALDEIVRRHEALRTTFPEIDGQAVQRIGEAARVPLPLVDLRGCVDPGGEARRLAEEDALEPFDLARGPLLRARLARLADAEHALLFNVHHMAYDGWSAGVFWRELAALYRAFAAGQPSPLPELPVQYADFARWQRQRMQGETLDRELAWWKERLAGGRPRLELPSDRPRRGEPGCRGAIHPLLFPRALSVGLRALARREGATLFAILLAGFAALLRRYTGEEDLCVGVPTAGRPRAELEGLIGFFTNSIVLRTDVSGDPTFRELLQRVREATGSDFEHDELPLERLVEELNPDRDLRGNPLFQVGFALQNAPREGLELPGLTIAPFEMDVRLTRLDLEVHLFDHESDLAAVFVYASDIFDPETIQRLGAHYVTQLEGALASPEARLSALPLLTDGEAQRVLHDWTATSTPYPRERSLVDLFCEQAGRRPGAVAVQYGDERLTYNELEERSNRLARVLSRRGVGPGVTVGLSIEPSVEMIVAIVGIVKAGGAYVPLDPAFPAERLRLMAEDSGLRLVLARASTRRTLEAAGAPVLCLDRDRAEIEAQEPSPLACAAGPEDLAYMIYTSGSTGVPKGVGVPHRAVVRLVRDTDYVQLTETDVIAQASNATFDAATFEVWGALLNGARLEGLDREVTLSPPALAKTLRQRGVSVLFLTTALFDQVARQTPQAFASLRVMLFGGEAVDPACVREVLKGGPPAELLHVYGPTENTTFSTWERVHAVDGEATTVPIGRPVANTRAYVLDERMRPVPLGIVGELYLAGDGLARGYLGRPDLTAELFVPDPFGPEPGGRLYRTGDRVLWRASGSLEFVGRIDHQVKLRGFRVEPGEIEAVLARHPAVGAAVVVVREDEPGDKRLVAYVAAPGGGLPEVADLRAWTRRQLPDYMVPSAFVRLEALPLSPNGKVDRASLPPPAAREQTPEPLVAPRSAIEATIAAAWREVLHLDAVGVHDNFFDLGGHSLSLLRLHRQLREALPGTDLKIVDLFRHPTIASLAAEITPSEPVAASRTARRATPRPAPDDAVAVVAMAGRFPGAGDVDRLWHNLVEGVESISRLSPEDLEAQGVPPAFSRDPRYVGARGVLEGADLFDASFFGYSPREAEMIDPQQRVFLETAWMALEKAGYVGDEGGRRTGVFAGASLNTYLPHVLAQAGPAAWAGPLSWLLSSDKDFLTTRVSYKLDLRGPSVDVQTACSTSLVAVHMACRSLLYGECDLALAGGVSVTVPLRSGYLYDEGGIFSPDGHCRAFDRAARGTLPGNGVGIVVLKRLREAVRDGDTIEAVIRGTAINNDGALKVGYSAPGVEGQAEVIAAAHTAAGVAPETIGYVEAHGTGTALGDPIEIRALREAFGPGRHGTRCAIGSLKTNLGHLDAAAGVAGLIKALLVLKHRQIPPSLHFEAPNPGLDLGDGPFFVNARLLPWPDQGTPRRAAVSSFGMGGTNAHAVLEEAPAPAPDSPPKRDAQLLTLSARTPEALEQVVVELADYLSREASAVLADVAYTLHVGRRPMRHRRVVVVRDGAEALRALAGDEPARVQDGVVDGAARGLVFLLPGQASGPGDPGRAEYGKEEVFRAEIDRAAEILRGERGLDLRELLFPVDARREEARRRLGEPALAQPALFLVEHALARLWMSWGVRPTALLGHGVGELVAACLAGVFSLEDALSLAAARGRIAEEGPAPMEPAAAAFRARVAAAERRAPRLPFFSNVTGDWITAAEAVDPAYWARQPRAAVPPGEAVSLVCRDERCSVLEVGPGSTPLVEAVGQLWAAGVAIDWPAFHAGERRRRVPLPTYPFERRRYWIEPAGAAAAAAPVPPAPRTDDVGDWFYRPTWRSTAPRTRELQDEDAGWLVFVDAAGLGARLVDRLAEAGRRVVSVTAGDRFAPLGPGAFQIRAGEPADYEALLAAVRFQERRLRVAHLWCVGPREVEATVERTTLLGLHSLTFLARAAGSEAAGREVDIAVVTSGMQEVGGEGLPCPERATVLGPCRVVPQEHPGVRCRSIDVRYPAPGPDEELEALVAECAARGAEAVVALRGGERWAQSFEPMRLAAARPRTRLRDEGVYVITGGLGGIGLALARHLALSVRARLVLVSRSGLLPRDAWAEWLETHPQDDATSRRIRAVEGLEAAGAEVLVLSADVTDPRAVEDALARAEARFGAVHGVVHTAGVAGGGVVALKTREAAERVLAPKVRGTLVLAAALQDRRPDFVVLCSSLAAVLGGPGQVDYCAANAFEDAYARHRASAPGPFFLSLGWDTWHEAGMAVETELPPALADERRAWLRSQGGIASAEGGEVFARALGQPLPHLLVSRTALLARLAAYAPTPPAAPGQAPRPAPAAVAAAVHSRPELGTPFVAPRDEIEQVICEVWREMLGFDRIGVHDDLFDLGGHSLLATQVVNRLRETFGVPLKLAAVFDTPTVAGMAAALVAVEPQPGQVLEVARLVQSVDRLSDEDVDRLLQTPDAWVEGAR